MARIEFQIEEQSGDLRSNEVALKFTILNNGQNPVSVQKIIPRIPQNVELIEIREPSYEVIVVEYNRICDEINLLLNEYIENAHEDLKKRKFNLRRDEYLSNRPISPFPDFTLSFVIIYQVLSNFSNFSGNETTEINKLNAYSVKIKNSKQAKDTLVRFSKSSNTSNSSNSSNSYSINLIESKIESLEQIELNNPDPNATIVTDIDPDSFFSIIYVLKFKRNDIDPKKYNISIDGLCKESGNSLIGSASISLIISPNPFKLSRFAVTFSLLGTIVKISLEGGISFIKNITIAHDVIVNSIISYLLQGFVTSVIAFVFFNIYGNREKDRIIRWLEKCNVHWISFWIICRSHFRNNEDVYWYHIE